MARALMVQGTASSVGKSLLVTGLCRYFSNQGMRVRPFKALNMALNAHVTDDGLEMARAQAVQAEAARTPATVAMNPILLKPEGNAQSQLVLLGRARGSQSAQELFSGTRQGLREAVLDAFNSLRDSSDLVIIEGAGSPAEVNLRARDLANMYMAKQAGAPVLLAGDIDRGGVLAAFVGTLELLEPEERERVAALWVNKFRGDIELLKPGLAWLSARTRKPMVGVLPHLGRLSIAEEDSLDVDARAQKPDEGRPLEIAVLRLPRISNHDEFQPFELEPEVELRFVEDIETVLRADLLVVPGSKHTTADLAWLRARGLDHAIHLRAHQGAPIVAICGGCQMLGERIQDPDHVESSEADVTGLGILPLQTRFERTKRTWRVGASLNPRSWLAGEDAERHHIPGYFIHSGRTTLTTEDASCAASVTTPDGTFPDGANVGNVFGTMVHGLFESDRVRHAALRALRNRRGLPSPFRGAVIDRDAEYERIAEAVRAHSDCALLHRLAGL